MAWKWYEIDTYVASVGIGGYYGTVQIFADEFYGNLRFHKEGPLPDCSERIAATIQRFYGHLDYQQMAMTVDLLRNEKPMNFGFDDDNPNLFRLTSGNEPIGEGDGVLAPE